jgi:hypothetical protein
VTPVEKCRITVEDVPFQAVLLENSGEGKEQLLTFTTDMAEQFTADESHPFRFEIDPDSGEPAPYIMVRDDLEAKLTRSVYYQTADLVVSELIDDKDWLGIWSSGIFFKIQPDET